MSIQVKEGANIPIHVQLESLDEDKYPRAILTDLDGVQYGSAIDLEHVANGLYQPASYPLMPSKDLIATYIIYSDIGHTIIDSPINEPTTDYFELNIDNPINVEILNKVNSLVAGAGGFGDSLQAVLSPEDGGLTGAIEYEQLQAYIEAEDMMAVSAAEDLTGEAQEDETLTGKTCDCQ